MKFTKSLLPVILAVVLFVTSFVCVFGRVEKEVYASPADTIYYFSDTPNTHLFGASLSSYFVNYSLQVYSPNVLEQLILTDSADSLCDTDAFVPIVYDNGGELSAPIADSLVVFEFMYLFPNTQEFGNILSDLKANGCTIIVAGCFARSYFDTYVESNVDYFYSFTNANFIRSVVYDIINNQSGLQGATIIVDSRFVDPDIVSDFDTTLYNSAFLRCLLLNIRLLAPDLPESCVLPQDILNYFGITILVDMPGDEFKVVYSGRDDVIGLLPGESFSLTVEDFKNIFPNPRYAILQFSDYYPIEDGFKIFLKTLQDVYDGIIVYALPIGDYTEGDGLDVFIFDEGNSIEMDFLEFLLMVASGQT